MIPTIDFAHPTYDRRFGTPLYWRDEVGGELNAAMMAYVNHGAWPLVCPEPTPEQLELVIAYLKYAINAPCWRDGDGSASGGRLARLRADAGRLATVADVRKWLGRCLQIGIDLL